MSSPRLHIAVDGPAGAGKSTIGRALAEELNCAYLDSGLMYRAVTMQALQRGIPLSDELQLERLAHEISFGLDDSIPATLSIDGQPAGTELYSPQVNSAVSEVSSHRQVRRELVALQRALADARCIVMVGRDIGTTVLPHADLKIWLTASAEVRARRRKEEQKSRVPEGNAMDTLTEIAIRDAHDSSRAESPLKRATDARVIETDTLSPAEALQEALLAVQDVMKQRQERSIHSTG